MAGAPKRSARNAANDRRLLPESHGPRASKASISSGSIGTWLQRSTGPLFGDEDVVFQADGQALLGDIDARLDGDHPARLERPVASGRCRARPGPSEWPRPCMKYFLQAGSSGLSCGGLLGSDQAQAHQFLGHLRPAPPASSPAATCPAPPERSTRRAPAAPPRRRPAAAREPAADRVGAGQVGAVVGVGGAHVDQQQVAGAALLRRCRGSGARRRCRPSRRSARRPSGPAGG